MFREILVPVDFTPPNARAIALAAELAAKTIALFHVIERIEGIPPTELRPFYRKLEARAARKMRTLAARLRRAGFAVKEEITLGNRVDEILRRAKRPGVDLVVLSSHRVDPERPGAGWGTISYKVGILAPCPVLLVK